MVFAPDTEAALRTTVNLINSAVNGQEKLATLKDLGQFLETERFTGSRIRNAGELVSIHALRGELRRLWTADQETAAAGVNRLLRDAQALPQLLRHDHWDWHLHATTRDALLKDRIGAEAAMALVDVIRGKEMDRMKVCTAVDCDAVVLDLSRNRSKRYCDTGNCDNRAHVAAYRARRAAVVNPAGAGATW